MTFCRKKLFQRGSKDGRAQIQQKDNNFNQTYLLFYMAVWSYGLFVFSQSME